MISLLVLRFIFDSVLSQARAGVLLYALIYTHLLVPRISFCLMMIPLTPFLVFFYFIFFIICFYHELNTLS